MFVYVDSLKMSWIIYRPEDESSKEKLMVASEVSVDVKTKNTFNYDYFPDFLLCLKNA